MISKKILSGLLAVIMMTSLSFTTGSAQNSLTDGLSYTVTMGCDTSDSYGNYKESGSSFDVNSGQLTDNNNATYYTAFRGQSRFVTFDFGSAQTVGSASAAFRHTPSAGIYAPRYVRLYLSDNGTDWMLAGSAEYDIPLSSTSPALRQYTITLSQSVVAKYASIEFSSDIFTEACEVAVYAGETDGARNVTPDEATTVPGYYPKGQDAMGGAGSIIKIYNGYFTEQELADNTPEELLPYVASVAADGTVTGKLFDSVAFVPCHVDYPSGGRLVKTNGKPGAVLSDWQLYIENTFSPGISLDALNTAVATRNAALQIDEKVRVFLTLPYPMMQDKPFGDLNGDGTTEYSRSLEERLSILSWYIDNVLDKFAQGSYTNLTLCGFYWYREEVNYSDSADEARLVQGAAALLHQKSLSFLFDPFYLSTGFDHWQELSFDGAVMQPNLIFRDYFDTSMLSTCADILRKYGLGIEIETNEPGTFRSEDGVKTNGLIYENYLFYGWKTGYIDALSTFYQGAGPGTIYDFCKSSDPYLRYLYDTTCAYIQGTYRMEPPSLSSPSALLTVESGSRRNTIDLLCETSAYRPHCTVEASALHGMVNVSTAMNKVFYTPDSDFSGSDTLTLTVTDSFGQTGTLTLPIDVKAPDAISDASPTPSEEAPSASGEDETTNSLPWILGVAALAALAVGAAWLFIRRKRK